MLSPSHYLYMVGVGLSILFNVSAIRNSIDPRNTMLKKTIIELLQSSGGAFPTSNLPALEAGRVNDLFRRLEDLNPTPDPASINIQSADGCWRVLYSNAPPPSNGQFGPFRGNALQIVDVGNVKYENRLTLFDGGLKLSLLADWKVRDTNTWRVTFRSISFQILGVQLPAIKFPTGTERTWCLTYVDNDLRIVRAGVDGGVSVSRQLGLVEKSQGESKDSYLFIMEKC